MSSNSMNESRVSLVNDGSVGSNTQKIIKQKDKKLQQKDKKICQWLYLVTHPKKNGLKF